MVVLCGSASVSAQQFSEEKYSLRGQVVNVVTGEPVSGALVEVYGGARTAQFSTSEGRYEFGELPRGNYGVIARKPGYFSDRDLGREAPGTEATHAVPSDEEVVLKLTPEGAISGRLEDEKGRPLEGVNVQAEMWMVSNGTKRLQPWPGGTVETDDEGNFRVGELYPGDYLLKFSERGGTGLVFRETPPKTRGKIPEEADKGKQGYGTQYYPGVTDENMASAIHVLAGVEAPVQQVLEPLRLYEIAGVVRGAPSEEGFSVTLMAAGSGYGEPRGKSQIFPSTGEFRIEGVPPGRYLLSATAQDATERYGRRSSQLVAQTVLEVNGDVAGIALMLGHGWTIGVRVTEVSTKGTEYGHQLRVSLQSTEFLQQIQQVSVPPPVNEPQAPRGFENVAAGTYSVEASPEGWGYVASIRCAGADLLKEDLRVGTGAAVAPIEITLRNDGATLNLSAVENGKPVTARVIVYSEEYPKRSTAVMTWPTSTVDLANLAPGTYKLVATLGIREPEFRNPLAMAKYLSHAQSVTLAPEASANVQVEVQEEPEP
jgi:hypothetical protein